MATHASKLVDQIATIQLSPVLKGLAYRKAGLTWRKQEGPILRIVEVQKSSGNTYDLAKFTLNIGLFHPQLYRELEQEDPPPKVSIAQCRPQTRMNAFKGGHDHWWELTARNVAEIGEDVARTVSDHAVPWLEGARSLTDMLDRLVQLEDFYPAAVVAWMTNRTDAADLVAQAVRKIEPRNARYAAWIQQWARDKSICSST